MTIKQRKTGTIADLIQLDPARAMIYYALMPDVLEAPQARPPRAQFRFTPENARIYAAKSAERRRRVPFRFPPPAQAEQLVPPDERLDLLNEQIGLTRAALKEPDLKPGSRSSLIRALCGLLDQLRIARGEPTPGVRKPAPDKPNRLTPAAAPRLAQPGTPDTASILPTQPAQEPSLTSPAQGQPSAEPGLPSI